MIASGISRSPTKSPNSTLPKRIVNADLKPPIDDEYQELSEFLPGQICRTGAFLVFGLPLTDKLASAIKKG
jgi:hypothetical protein